jgi:replication factor C small subunit
MIDNNLWTEKYRPETLDEVALSEENRKLLERYLNDGEIPHILMSGPAGCGKTTVAKIITSTLDCAELLLNASNERGIDTIRDKVGTFVKGRMGGRWNIVFLDEADALTRDAQTSMRNLMETYASRGRFIMTCNYPHKIIDPIKSRCQVIEMSKTPVKERFKVLSKILTAEGVNTDDPQVVLSYAKAFTDMRRMIMAAQKSVFANDGNLQPASDVKVTGDQLFKACKTQDYQYLVEVSQRTSFNHVNALEDLFWAIPDREEFSKAASWRAEVGRAIHESKWTPDPVTHFLGTCSELMNRL